VLRHQDAAVREDGPVTDVRADPSRTTGRWAVAQPWVSTAARIVLGAVWIVAGSAKVTDLAGSVRAVRAYRLLPEGAAQVVGAGLPVVEIALGVLLLAGLGTRIAAAISSGLFIVFIVGIASAWARGLRIDCGCFGGGGDLGRQADPAYGIELARDFGLLLLAALVVALPRGRFALDRYLFRPVETS
jgi:uncharacterized membrane protein YphA (DoxX/SURF4 family)